MDASQWTQGIVVKAAQMQMEESKGAGAAIDQKRPRPQKEKAVNCPRCKSINTKFCYYNNYSLSQPRYFCKTCRRYWTEGGTLRSVPVGGGSRKNKKSSSSKKEHVPDLNPILSFPLSDNNSSASQKGQDLNLGYGYNSNLIINPNLTAAMAPKGLSCFMPMAAAAAGNNNNNIFTSGFPSNSHELMKAPSLNFSLDGFGNINGYGNVPLGIDQDSSAKVFFPLHEDLKLQQASTSDHHHQQQQQQQFDQNRVHGSEPSVGYWGGMLGGSGLW